MSEDMDDVDDNDKFIPPNSTAGQLFKCNDKYVSIQQFYHYAHRGSLLHHLTFLSTQTLCKLYR